MSAYPWANKPAIPFVSPVPVPTAAITDEPTIQICINAEWLKYVIAACAVLTRDSTWSDNDPSRVDFATQNGYELLHILTVAEACPVPIQFQANPDYPQNWQYSLDGGTTWLDGPDTASAFTPEFIVEGGAPSGYELSVNGDHSATDIPLITANDPNAVITDPTTDLRNEITVSSGIEGIVIQGLAQVGVRLQNNGIAAEFQKIPGLGLAADAVTQIAQGSGYLYDLLRIVTAI